MKYTGKTYEGYITPKNLPENGIFVYGANKNFHSGAGTALIAIKYFGAIYGQGYRCVVGKSRGIITTDLTKKKRPSVPKSLVLDEIKSLYDDARQDPGHEYWIAYLDDNTPNLSGFTNQEIADMFSKFPIPDNCVFNKGFAELLNIIFEKEFATLLNN